MPGYFSRVVPRSVRVCSDVPGGTYARVVPDEERGVVKKNGRNMSPSGVLVYAPTSRVA